MLGELCFVFGCGLVRREGHARTEHKKVPDPLFPRVRGGAWVCAAARSVFSIPAVLTRPVVTVPSPRASSLTARRSTSSVGSVSASVSTFSVVDRSARAPPTASALTGRD